MLTSRIDRLLNDRDRTRRYVRDAEALYVETGDPEDLSELRHAEAVLCAINAELEDERTQPAPAADAAEIIAERSK